MISLGDIGAGAKLGPYELLVPIARGATAMIWAARVSDIPGLETIIAIKALLPAPKDEPDFEEKFRTAAELASQVRHPHVAEILDVGDHEGVLYIAMEWVEGEAISTILKTAGKGMPFGIAARIAIDAAIGLHAAHELRRDNAIVGLVHRDVSPSNILVSYEGAVKIVGFGTETPRRSSTKGVPAFIAPEQTEGKSVDRRADVFALGACLYQMVTGKHPFESGVDPKAPIQLVPTCPPALDAAIVKAIAKDRDKRFATMLELSEAVGAALAASKPAEVGAYSKGLFTDRAEKRQAAIAQAIRATDERGAEQSSRGGAASRPPTPAAIAAPVVAKATAPIVTKEPVRAVPPPAAAPAPPPAAPSRVLADLGEVYRESDEPLAIGIRLRITLDVLESIEDAPLRKRTAKSRMHLDRVRVDAEGISSVEGTGDATGAALLAWEILAGRASKEDPPPGVGEIAEDVPAAVDEVLREALESSAIATTSALHARLDDASRGFADATGDVREAIAKWLREVSVSAPAKPQIEPTAPVKPEPKKSAPAPTPAPQAKPEPKPEPKPATPAISPIAAAPPTPKPAATAPILAAAEVRVAATPPVVVAPPAAAQAPIKAAPPVAAKTPAPAAKAAPPIEVPVPVKEPIDVERLSAEPISAAPISAEPISAAPISAELVSAEPVVEAPVAKAEPVHSPAPPPVEIAKTESPAPAAVATPTPKPAATSPTPPAVATPTPKPAATSEKRQTTPEKAAGKTVAKAPLPAPARNVVVAEKTPRAAKRPPPPKVKQYDAPIDDAPSPTEPDDEVATSAPSLSKKADASAEAPEMAPVSLPAESIADWQDEDDKPPPAKAVAPAAIARKAPPVPTKQAELEPTPPRVKARVSVRPAAAKEPAVASNRASQAPTAPAPARRSVRPPAVQATPSASVVEEEDGVVAAQRIASRRRLVVGVVVVGALALTAVLGIVISNSTDPGAGADSGASSSDPIPPLRERMRGPRAVEQPVETAAVPVPSPTPTIPPAPTPSASASPSARASSGPSAPPRPKPTSDTPKPFLPEHI